MPYLGNPPVAIDALISDASIVASKLASGVAASNLGYTPYNPANVLNTPTGASVVSGASINLNSVTGNLIHITGTTAITTVLLSTGFRTVVFDGVLTLTHNSVTNKLPGGVNITTAVGDVASYESDGTTVYCTNYVKAISDVVTTPTAVQTLTNKTLSGASNTITVDGLNAVGFLAIPQNSQSVAYTTVLTDSGKHILHPSADTAARIFTIPANSTVAYPIGTALTFVNQASAGVVTIAITTDVMRLAGAGTTGSRTLAANGIATAVKLTATEWIVNGSGLT